MKIISIQTKFLAMSITLVLLTTLGISLTYYVLTTQRMHQESRQRIQIAFDILLDDLHNRMRTSTERIAEFLATDSSLRLTTSAYMDDPNQIERVTFLTSYLKETADILARFGRGNSINRLMLYGIDQRLLLFYQRDDQQEQLGAYMVSATGKPTSLLLSDFGQLSPILFGDQPIPEAPLPDTISASYPAALPEELTSRMFSEGRRFGFRMVTPLYHREQKTGILVADVFYHQSLLERYASLTKTEIQFVKPTASEESDANISCQQIAMQEREIPMVSITRPAPSSAEGRSLSGVEEEYQNFYQGRCAFTEQQRVLGMLVVNLSQQFEQQQIQNIMIAVLFVSGAALVISFGLSLLLSRRVIRAIQNMVHVVGSISTGDLREKALIVTHDEVGMLAVKVNQMSDRMREMVGEVQRAGVQVSTSSGELSATAREQEQMMTEQMTSATSAVQSVQEIRQVAENLVHTMQSVASMFQDTAAIASQGQGDLVRMKEVMQHMEAASETISNRLKIIDQKAENITTMVTTITKVAEQTNLLSLNAAIEAEKAGEFGRGFTIVAREIRRLADQSAVATLDIEQMVHEMQSAVATGVMEMDKFIAIVRHSVSDVNRISAQLTRIIEQVQTLMLNFEDANTAMGSQAENARKINEIITNLSEEMVHTKISLHETYTAIDQLDEAAKGLQEQMARFNVGSL